MEATRKVHKCAEYLLMLRSLFAAGASLAAAPRFCAITLNDLFPKRILRKLYKAIPIIVMIVWQAPVYANYPPIVLPSSDKVAVRVGDAITFTANSHDTDNDALTIGWNFNDGCSYTLFYDSFNQVYHIGSGSGLWYQDVAFDAENNKWTSEWKFNSSGACSSVSESVSHAFGHNLDKKVYLIGVVATDGPYLVNGSTSVTVYGMPVASVAGSYFTNSGKSITFDGTASYDPKNEALSYQWDFGDGETGSGVSPSHTYAERGQYTASLIVCAGNYCSLPARATVSVGQDPSFLVPIINLLLLN